MSAECENCSNKEYLQSLTEKHNFHNHAPNDTRGDSGVEMLVYHKVGALLFMAAATIIVALIPIYVRNKISSSSSRKRRERLLSVLLCFGAGNLIGVTFIHIMPHTREYINDAIDHGLIPDMHFPLAEVLICTGFFLIYVIEDIVHECVERHYNKCEGCPVQNTACNNAIVEVGRDCKESERALVRDITIDKANEDISHKGHDCPDPATLMKGEYTTVINAVTVITALSIHDVFEGFSIGLEQKAEDVWLLAVVLVIHKCLLAFSIGMELLQEGVKLIPYLAAMITFGLATPIGGAIGLASLSVESKTASGVMVPAVLNGLSGGCILFCVFCEIISRERARPNKSFIRIVSLMLGFGMILGLALLPHHSHEHHSHHHPDTHHSHDDHSHDDHSH